MIKALCIILCITMLIPSVTVFTEGLPETTYMVHGPNEVTHYFDITDGSWYAESCRFAYWSGFMVGTSETTFSPHSYMTREMAVVTIVQFIKCGCYDIEEFIVPTYTESYFTDVKPGHWYSDYIQFAYENGLTAGIGNGEFGLGQPITRQDFLVMMSSVLCTDDSLGRAYIIGDIPDTPMLSDDVYQVSDYAQKAFNFFKETRKAFAWIQSTDTIYFLPRVIKGSPNEEYRLKDPITRAEAAMMLDAYSYYPKFFAGSFSICGI